jgi:hypothetical protein
MPVYLSQECTISVQVSIHPTLSTHENLFHDNQLCIGRLLACSDRKDALSLLANGAYESCGHDEDTVRMLTRRTVLCLLSCSGTIVLLALFCCERQCSFGNFAAHEDDVPLIRSIADQSEAFQFGWGPSFFILCLIFDKDLNRIKFLMVEFVESDWLSLMAFCN